MLRRRIDGVVMGVDLWDDGSLAVYGVWCCEVWPLVV